MGMLKKIFESFIQALGRIDWEQKNPLTQEDKDQIQKLLTKDYYIINTRRSNHLSTYAIAFSNLVLAGKWGFYSHVLMNLEDEAQSPEDFRLIEAIGRGTTYSTFDYVFGSIDACALLKPKTVTIDEWTLIMDKANSELGKPYDTLFDLKNDNALSCVELIRAALMSLPNYETRFANFEKMIKKNKNLTPQMFADCDDFEVAYSVNRNK